MFLQNLLKRPLEKKNSRLNITTKNKSFFGEEVVNDIEVG